MNEERVPGLCVEHEDLCWRYTDGSVGCFYCSVVETACDCTFGTALTSEVSTGPMMVPPSPLLGDAAGLHRGSHRRRDPGCAVVGCTPEVSTGGPNFTHSVPCKFCGVDIACGDAVGEAWHEKCVSTGGDAPTDFSNIYGDCPYYRGLGTCTFGCTDEPACVTSEPEGGWPQTRVASLVEAARAACEFLTLCGSKVPGFDDEKREHADALARALAVLDETGGGE